MAEDQTTDSNLYFKGAGILHKESPAQQFQEKYEAELSKRNQDPSSISYLTLPVDTVSSLTTALKNAKEKLIKRQTETNGLQIEIYRTNISGLYLVTKSLNDKDHKLKQELLAFVGDNQIKDFEINPDDPKTG